MVELADEKAAANFSLDLQNALESLSNGETSIEQEIANQLLARGLIEEIEKGVIIVSPRIKKQDLKKIQVLEEVSR
jgi:hypothetical protein